MNNGGMDESPRPFFSLPFPSFFLTSTFVSCLVFDPPFLTGLAIMLTKEAEVFLLDVGPSAGLPVFLGRKANGLTRLDASKQYIQGRWLPQLTYPRKTYKTALILFGSTSPDNPMHKEAGDYKHVQITCPLGRLETQMLERVGCGEGKGVIQTEQGTSDWLDGMIIALQHLHEQKVDSGHGYVPRLILLTPATTPVNTVDLGVVQAQIRRMGIVLSIVGLCQKAFQPEDEVCKQQEALKEMAITSGGRVMSFSQAQRSHLPLHIPAVAPNTTFQGPLLFPGLSKSKGNVIPVVGYAKIAKVKELSKEKVRRAQSGSPLTPLEIWEIVRDGEEGREERGEEGSLVPKEEIERGYVIGRSLLSPDQATSLDSGWNRGKDRKGFRIDRFIQRDQVRLEWLVGTTTVIFPGEEGPGKGIWAALVEEMISDEVVGVGRYTRLDWEITRTGLFFPWRQGLEECLHFITIGRREEETNWRLVDEPLWGGKREKIPTGPSKETGGKGNEEKENRKKEVMRRWLEGQGAESPGRVKGIAHPTTQRMILSLGKSVVKGMHFGIKDEEADEGGGKEGGRDEEALRQLFPIQPS
ncbi:hypothetical protein BJ684DRAFT_17224, partial [Piptocephalis cylindrospora]